MHFKNENDINSKTHHAATTSTSSSTSSSDSGVIIIDNKTTFGKKINSDNQNNSSKNNNSSNGSKSPPQSNGNIKNTNFGWSGENDTTTDKIESTTKDDNCVWNEKLNNPSHYNNIKCNEQSYKSNKISDDRLDSCNVAVRNINIENVINISKGHVGSADVSTNSDNHLRHQDCFVQSSNPNRSSPTVSIRSTSISIVSIDENAIDSSIIDSDSDREADAEGVHTNYVVKKLGQQTTYAAGSPDVPNINKGLTVISQKITPNGIVAKDVLNGGFIPARIPSELNGGPISPTTPQIGSIALTNSTDVTFGDKHFYEGPVTIQQILIDRRDKSKDGGENGHDNPTFVNEPGCDTSGTKSSSPTSSTGSPFSFICRRKAIIITVTIAVLFILTGVVFLTMKSPKSKLQLGDGDDSRMNIPINSTIDSSEESDEDYTTKELMVVSREDWNARAPKTDALIKLSLPVHRVIISHTASDSCAKKETCSERVRVIQDFHMDSNEWDDIGYNFLVGGDGRVYSARGWNNQGAHTKGYNTDSIGIAFIGTFTTIEPTKHQIIAAKLLIEEGVKLQKVAPNFCLYGARQLGATESPGLALYNIIKTWPHWSESVKCNGFLG